MKTITTILVAMFCFVSIQAQKMINKSYSGNVETVKLNGHYADFKVETHSGSDIIIEGKVDINLNLDNDAFRLEVEEKGNALVINTHVESDGLPNRVIARDKSGTYIMLSTDGGSNANEIISKHSDEYDMINYGMKTNIELTIKMPRSKNLEVDAVYGNVMIQGNYQNMDIDLTYGDIDLIQEAIPSNAGIKLHSTYGHVDFTLPSSSNLKFDVSSTYGEVLTDLDLENESGSKNNGMTCYGTKGTYILNNGRNIAHVESTYDNVYLRAKK